MCCCSETKQSTSSKAGVTDVVCGMQVDPATAVGFSEYQDKRYFFCGVGCKQNFDADPKHYA
jgi:Cu+-exporting ATPase